jgi:hypothetical protein
MLGDKFFHKSTVIIIMMTMIVINTKCTFVSNKDVAVRIRFMSIFTMSNSLRYALRLNYVVY